VFREDPYVMPLMRTTAAVTMARGADAPNVLPGTAEAMINCRLLQGDTPEGMLQRLRSLVADLPVTVEMVMENPASPLADPECALFRTLADTVTEAFGPMPVIPTVTTVATDSRHYLPLAEQVLRFCPLPVTKEEYSAMHGAPERIRLDSLALGGSFFRLFMKKL
jgi:carboxypeptidase PM20D1